MNRAHIEVEAKISEIEALRDQIRENLEDKHNNKNLLDEVSKNSKHKDKMDDKYPDIELNGAIEKLEDLLMTLRQGRNKL